MPAEMFLVWYAVYLTPKVIHFNNPLLYTTTLVSVIIMRLINTPRKEQN